MNHLIDTKMMISPNKYIRKFLLICKYAKFERSSNLGKSSEADFPYDRCYTLPIGTRTAKQSEESAKGRHRLIFFYVWNTS